MATKVVLEMVKTTVKRYDKNNSDRPFQESAAYFAGRDGKGYSIDRCKRSWKIIVLSGSASPFTDMETWVDE